MGVCTNADIRSGVAVESVSPILPPTGRLCLLLRRRFRSQRRIRQCQLRAQMGTRLRLRRGIGHVHGGWRHTVMASECVSPSLAGGSSLPQNDRKDEDSPLSKVRSRGQCSAVPLSLQCPGPPILRARFGEALKTSLVQKARGCAVAFRFWRTQSLPVLCAVNLHLITVAGWSFILSLE